MNAAAIIELRAISKRFGAVAAVDGVSLTIREGEFFALLGPSGCGKTTLLRMLAGFEIPSGGAAFIDGRDMTSVPPNRRPVNMVFQSYAVFPHMTVFDNVAYGLRVGAQKKIPAEEIKTRVAAALELVRLGGLEARRPEELSGGQRQRVALARALIKRPRVLLLDEPLSALDAKLRAAMQIELVRLQKTVGITFVIVTHDQDEALSMANRIAVMEKGAVRQVAAPAALYEYPNCRFVADFIGSMNIFDGEMENRGGELRIRAAGLGDFTAPGDAAPEGFLSANNKKIGVAVRPEKIRLFDSEPREAGLIARAATVENISYHGAESRVSVRLPSGAALVAALQNDRRQFVPPQAGARLWAAWRAADTLLLPD
jgi:spermidine/putrescine ABC transporter ATP-binding subunit